MSLDIDKIRQEIIALDKSIPLVRKRVNLLAPQQGSMGFEEKKAYVELVRTMCIQVNRRTELWKSIDHGEFLIP